MKKSVRFSLLMGMLAMMLTSVTMTSCGGDKDEPTPEAKLPHEVVDMGFPSGTKWAAYNVGATKPEEVGSYFAFGETKPKSDYSAETYQCPQELENLMKIGSIVGTKYDAATANWGANYVMPTIEQGIELYEYTTKETVTIGGVTCTKLTSKINSKSILLPRAGFYVSKQLYIAEQGYYYMGSMEKSSEGLGALELQLYAGSSNLGFGVTPKFEFGKLVRAVLKK